MKAKAIVLVMGSAMAVVIGFAVLHWKDVAVRYYAMRLTGNQVLQGNWLERPADSIEGRAILEWFLENPYELGIVFFRTLEDNIHPRDVEWNNFDIMERGIFALEKSGASYWYDRLDGSGGGSDGGSWGQDYDAKCNSLCNIFKHFDGKALTLHEKPECQLTFFVGKQEHLVKGEGFGFKFERTGGCPRQEQASMGPGIWTGKELIVLGSPQGGAFDPVADRWRVIRGIPHISKYIVQGQYAVWLPAGSIVTAWRSQARTIAFDYYEVESDIWRTIGEAGPELFDDPVEHSDNYFAVIGGAGLDDHAIIFTQFFGKGGVYGPFRGFQIHPNGQIRAISVQGAPKICSWETPAIYSFRNKVFVWGLGSDGMNHGGIWNEERDAWENLQETEASSRSRSDFGHCAIAGEVIIFGGHGSSGTGTDLIDNGLIYAIKENQWRPLPVLPPLPGRRDFSMIWTGKEIVLWRGGLTEGSEPEIVLDPVTGSWKPMPVQGGPGPRYDPICLWAGRELFVVGGYSPPRYCLDAWAFNPAAGIWRRIGNFPRLRDERK